MGVEDGKFLRAATIVPLNPDGSVPFDSEELLRRTFGFGGEEEPPSEKLSSKTPSYDVVLHYRYEDELFKFTQSLIQDISDPRDVLKYAVTNSPFAESCFLLFQAEIRRRSVREAMLGNASDEDIIELYRRIDGPEPIYIDLAVLAEKARGQGRVMDD